MKKPSAGFYLRERRLARGLTQPEIGKLVQISTSYVCDIENGYRHLSLKTVASWSAAYDVPLAELAERVLQDEVNASGLELVVRIRPNGSRTLR